MSPSDPPLLSLVEACLDSGHADAWARLIRRVQPIFARAAYRVAMERGAAAAAEIDDIVQEICLKLGADRGALLRRLPGESEQAAFAYLKVIAINAARDYFKAKYAGKRGSNLVVSLESPLEELVGLQAARGIERQILIGQVDAALSADRRERTVFWLYYRQGFTAREIAAIPSFGLTSKGVESLIHRLTVAVRVSFCGEKGESTAGAF